MAGGQYVSMDLEAGGTVAAVVDLQPVSPSAGKGRPKNGSMQTSLLMSPEGGPAESSAPVTASQPAAAAAAPPTAAERWRALRPVVWVMLADAGIFFVISLVTFAFWNTIVSAIGLAAGVAWYLTYYLRLSTERGIKMYYWPGLVAGGLASVGAVKDLVIMILKIVDSPVAGGIAFPFRLVFVLLNGVLGGCALWVWVVGRRCRRQLEAEAAAAAAAGGMTSVVHRAQTWFSGVRDKALAGGAKAAVTRSVSMAAATPPAV